MSTHLKEKREKILEILEQLAQESSKGIPIIVEGKNDVRALRIFPIEGKILMAKAKGKSMLDVVSEIEASRKREVILLLDFDRRGKEWTKHLKQHLEKIRVKPNVIFWKKFLSIAGRELKDVQGLTSYLETLTKKLTLETERSVVLYYDETEKQGEHK